MYLNCHTYYSFKYGTLSVTQLLTQAQQLKVDALVLTDINNTSGCLEFIRESKKYGVRPIIGIDFRTGSKQHYIGIAKNNEGFLELNQHLSAYLSEQLAFSTQAPMFYNSYVIYPYGSMHPKQLREHEYIGVKIHELNKLIFSECRSHLHKLVVLHPVTFLNKKDFNAHRLLRAIDNNTLLSKLPVSEQTNENELFYEEVKLLQLYEDYPQLVINTRRITDACSMQLLIEMILLDFL